MLMSLILIVAGFLAGVLNTIAGGGTFLTFPALVYAGIPPVVARLLPKAVVRGIVIGLAMSAVFFLALLG